MIVYTQEQIEKSIGEKRWGGLVCLPKGRVWLKHFMFVENNAIAMPCGSLLRFGYSPAFEVFERNGPCLYYAIWVQSDKGNKGWYVFKLVERLQAGGGRHLYDPRPLEEIIKEKNEHQSY